MNEGPNKEIEPDFEGMGVAMEPGVCTVTTAPDNKGDDAGTTEHQVGYMAYYNKASMDGSKKLPLVLCFHGGGDSAMCMVSLAEWRRMDGFASNRLLVIF